MTDRTNETNGLLWWMRVGERVVFLGSPDIFRMSKLAAIGEVYQIAEVAAFDSGEGQQVHLGFDDFPFENGCYGSGRLCLCPAKFFRPVREASIDSLRSLLNPTPETVREMEDANV